MFERRLEPEEINSLVRELPNYTEPFSNEKKEVETVCWSCKEEITRGESNCDECNYATRCDCGKCACDKPGNEGMKTRRENY